MFSSGWAKLVTQPSLSHVMSTISVFTVGRSPWRDRGAAGKTWSIDHASGSDWNAMPKCYAGSIAKVVDKLSSRTHKKLAHSDTLMVKIEGTL